MDDVAIGRVLRMLRIRQGLRLDDLAASTRLSASTLGRHERGLITSLQSVRRHGEGLGVRTALSLIGRGAYLPRLRDDEHSAIVNALARAYAAARWEAAPEVSFNEWGERGRIDLLAARMGAGGARLHVIEVKPELADLQALFGSMDIQRRLAPDIARRRGWWPVESVGLVMAVASTSHNRAIVGDRRSLFDPFLVRTLRPAARYVPDVRSDKVLLWVPATVARRRAWLAGRRRVRVPRRGAFGAQRTGS